METSRPIRVVVALALAVLASIGVGLGSRAQTPTPTAPPPAKTVDFEPDFDHWVRVLIRQSESSNVEVARSARAALEGLGARGRERADALRAEGRRPPSDRPAARPGFPGRDALHGGPNGGRGPRGAPPGPSESDALDRAPRTGPRADGPPPRCGPGCCLHGRGPGRAGDGGPLERDRHGPPPHRRDLDRDPRTGPPPGRAPHHPLPPRDEPSRTPRSVPQET